MTVSFNTDFCHPLIHLAVVIITEGMFLAGKKHGVGKLTYADGSTYDGTNITESYLGY